MLLKKQTVQIKLFYMEEYGTCQSTVKVEEKKKYIAITLMKKLIRHTHVRIVGLVHKKAGNTALISLVVSPINPSKRKNTSIQSINHALHNLYDTLIRMVYR